MSRAARSSDRNHNAKASGKVRNGNGRSFRATAAATIVAVSMTTQLPLICG